MWSLIAARPGGFPWLAIAGKVLAGWLVIDLDGTLITARSDKEGAAPTFKMGYGFHPLGAWCANTAESLAMLLRPGNAGSNTFADHLTVLTAAIRQIPAQMRSRLLVRVDGAGASHELIATCCRCRPGAAPCCSPAAGRSPRPMSRRSGCCPPPPGRPRWTRTGWYRKTSTSRRSPT